MSSKKALDIDRYTFIDLKTVINQLTRTRDKKNYEIIG
jgi:hypothetical protein